MNRPETAGERAARKADKARKRRAKQREQLRDQIAMAALTGIMQRPGCMLFTAIAEEAYNAADAMLKQREQQP